MEITHQRKYGVLDYALRGIYLAISLTINYLLFYLVPISLFNSVGQLTPNLETNIASYFFVIGVLTVIRIILKEHLLGAIASVSSDLIKIIYIYTITQGGMLTMILSGYLITINFKPLVYLLLMPLFLDTIKQVYDLANKSKHKLTG